MKNAHKSLAILVMLLAATMTASAQDDINLDLGTIPAGQQVRVQFDVLIQDNLPANLTQISNQGVVRSDNAGVVFTDDPDTGEPRDATVTSLNVLLINPFIRKQADPPFALPGDSVVFSFTVSNPNAFDVSNIVAIDAVPPELEVLGASAPIGAVVVNGQTVEFTLGALAANQSVTVTVNTRIRESVQTPFVLVNEVCGRYDAAPQVCATATVLSVAELPGTGETPLWRNPLLLIMAAITGLFLSIGTRSLMARRQR
jgi:uncharacterized repeat protein (TIGR01451 family)